MKEEFKKWLISLNCEGVNSLGINEIVSRVDEELRIVRANEQERIVLGMSPTLMSLTSDEPASVRGLTVKWL